MAAVEIEINGLGSNGEGVGRLDGLTVFVDGALPGEKVLAEIEVVKKNYSIGALRKILRESVDRVKPACPLFGECGGCQLQHLKYSAQLHWKRQQVVDAVERIGGLKGVEIFETLGMENPWRYRNKMQFPVGRGKGGLVIGCYARGSHKIVDTDACLIQREASDKVLAAVRKILQRFNISPYDEDSHRGIIRHVMSRTGFNDELMIVLVTAVKHLPNDKNISKAIRAAIPNVAGIQQNVQTFHNNVILGRETKILFGKAAIRDKIGGLEFNISARSFFQVNTAQAEILYRTAKDFAALTGRETVIDAYCGTGTIGLFMAKAAYKVFGIEIVREAIDDAVKNARENKIRNAEFLVGDVVKILSRLEVPADVVVVDPPRAGCDRKVLESFAAMNVGRVVYVSCNPATLARDLAILAGLGYHTKKIQPVDMFPHSSHVEAVAQVEKISLT